LLASVDRAVEIAAELPDPASPVRGG
jgi:hypothetical protein